MAVAIAKPAARTAVEAILARELVYVTGKGGAGKTTVAAALGAAANRLGRHAIVCEATGAHRLAASLAVDPRHALIEWMRAQPGGAVAAAVLGRSRAFEHFVDAAPGAKELVTVGKVADLARGGEFDVVVVDSPSTGHALGMLSAPGTVSRVAARGPIAAQAHALDAYLADDDRSAYVGVTLPEEMALHELLELEDGLQRIVGRRLDLVVVNAVYPDRFTEAEAETMHELEERSAKVHAALDEHRLAMIHAARTQWLRERVAAPVVTLPFLFTAEIGAREHLRLARELVP